MARRTRASVVAALGAAPFLLAACFPGAGGCSETAAAEFRSIRHYEGMQLEPQPHMSGACNATFSTRDDPDMVLESYRAEIEAAGYEVVYESTTPIVGDSNQIIGEAVGFDAESDRFFFSINAEVFRGQEATYNVFVEELGPNE